jgi:O-succinylbenzoic acid--CoA ligase
MNNLPKRPLLAVSDQWSIPQLRIALAQALDGTGPALALAHTTRTEVDARVALLLTTTGSTGTPKEVFLSGEAITASARLANEFLGATANDRWSLKLPVNHIAGINVLARSIALATRLETDGAEFTAIVPTQLHRALTTDSALLAELQKCKAVLVGGAATSERLLQQAREASINVVTTYGSSETSGGCIYNNEPLAGVEVRINSAGLLEISTPTLAEAVASNGWYTTSDRAEIVDGKVLILGRADDVIISGGENISLSQVERVLADLAPEFMAVGVPSDEWGTELVLLSISPLDLQIVKERLTQAIGKYAVPKEIVIIDAIPLKGIGKPDRERAFELYLAHHKGR